jgi:hypothetical protein
MSVAKIVTAIVKRLATAALPALGIVAFAHAQVTIGGCATSAERYVVNNNGSASTTSAGYSNVDGATVAFTQGGATPSCVLVFFSGAAAASPGASMFVRATLDGQPTALPAEIQFFHNSTAGTLFFESRAANFVFPSVTPGTHRVRIQFEFGSGSFAQFTNTTHIVRYRR